MSELENKPEAEEVSGTPKKRKRTKKEPVVFDYDTYVVGVNIFKEETYAIKYASRNRAKVRKVKAGEDVFKQ